MEYRKLTQFSLSTMLSEDLRTYFLLGLASSDGDTHRRILGMYDNEYARDRITNTVLIQLDRPDAGRRSDNKNPRMRYSFPATSDEDPDITRSTCSPLGRAASETSAGPSASQAAAPFVFMADESPQSEVGEEYDMLQADLEDFDDSMDQLDSDDVAGGARDLRSRVPAPRSARLEVQDIVQEAGAGPRRAEQGQPRLEGARRPEGLARVRHQERRIEARAAEGLRDLQRLRQGRPSGS